ncbi:MAG: hypothetical protein HOQ09_01340 [Gemmatimonadaceae bacterium]|nr:hypothetical protein [Gemmatimonadaceae bacterium]
MSVPEPARHGHATVDLTGSWTTGSVGEPAAPRIVASPQCNYSPSEWIIEQSGDSVHTWIFPDSHDQGIATPPAPRIAADGWVSGVDVVIGPPSARYVLRYDSTTGHLRGTLNGAPFWAVRFEIVRPEGCIPPP